MTFELTAALVVFLAVVGWRLVRRREASSGGHTPEVGSAPPGSDPVADWEYDADGLGMHLRPRAPATQPDEDDRAD